jgi:hypothetical protein
VLVGGAEARAEKPSVALMGFDALGMDAERVGRLEVLFLKELERLTAKAVPSRRQIARLPRRLRRCQGGNQCLSKIGKALKVDLVVAGNVAALGDSYVVNIKAVQSADGRELRRIESDPLRGQPDELIEAIRVAAYRLLAPDELQGSLLILADRKGASVELDGKNVGTTPLAAPLQNLALGKHKLRVAAAGFGEFSEDVVVRFQKTTRVAVQLVDLTVKSDPGSSDNKEPVLVHREKPAWYRSTWFYVTLGVSAAVIGGYIGYQVGRDEIIQCDVGTSQCM